MQHIQEFSWQHNIIHINATAEKRSNIVVVEASNATSDTCDIEKKVFVFGSEVEELVNIWFDCLHAALHSWYGIALPLQTDALSLYGTKVKMCNTRGTT